MGRGEIVTNENSITMKEGSGYAEKTIDVKDETGELAVETSEGKKAIKVPADNGFYILNLKTDTIVGSLQNFGKDLSSSKVMTQEELKVKIDSLQQLTKGANIVNGRNYFIKPNELGKVSSNVDALVFGPFQKIPGSINKEEGKTPEIYKFYTNTEVRELIANLKKLSIY